VAQQPVNVGSAPDDHTGDPLRTAFQKLNANDAELYAMFAALNFADAEVPAGVIDGANAVFTLAHTPNPAASLQLFKNGVLQSAGGVDYTLAVATITYVAAAKPQVGDAHVAFYRY